MKDFIGFIEENKEHDEWNLDAERRQRKGIETNPRPSTSLTES